MSENENEKPPVIKRLMGEATSQGGVDMKTALRGNGKGGFRASTTFNDIELSGEGWTEQQAQTALRGKVNAAIAAGKFDTRQTH